MHTFFHRPQLYIILLFSKREIPSSDSRPNVMNAVALPLALPAILTGIRKFIIYFNSTDTRIENLLRKCRVLERAVSRLAEIISDSVSDPLTDDIVSECAEVVKSMESLMARCGQYDAGSHSSLSKTARLKTIWNDHDLNALLARLDDCRANVQLFLIMTIP